MASAVYKRVPEIGDLPEDLPTLLELKPLHSNMKKDGSVGEHEVLYGRGSPALVLTGLSAIFLLGLSFIAGGLVIWNVAATGINGSFGYLDLLSDGGLGGTYSTVPVAPNRHTIVFSTPGRTSSTWSILPVISSLAVSIIVSLCTEITGFVHGTSLKWALARGGRLRFNANLRLFRAAGRRISINGNFTNALFGLSTVIAFAASSVVIRPGLVSNSRSEVVLVSFLPPILVGTALSLQALLCLIAFFTTQIPTWSSNPLDVTAALYQSGQIDHFPSRCMHCVEMAETPSTYPIYPSHRQPSPWSSHKSVRYVLWLTWALVPCGLVCGGAVWAATMRNGHWNYLNVSGTSGEQPVNILVGILFVASIQSVITMDLHCCELVATLARDEEIWRKASSPKGIRPAANPFWTALTSWQTLVLLVAKPVIPFLFGRAVSMVAGDGVDIHPLEIWILTAGLAAVSAFVTFIAFRRPVGPQPVAYGHVQTLANLIDEWPVRESDVVKVVHPEMYWGHKADGEVCHAGTSDYPLTPVRMDALYAGGLQNPRNIIL